MKKIGRNDSCWCGNGNKYKRCHENTDEDKHYYALVPTLGEFGAKNQVLSDSMTTDVEKEFEIANKIIQEKQQGNRNKPSQYLKIDSADLLENEIKVILDMVGYTCDQCFPLGRSTACIYFAVLLKNVLNELFDKDAKALVGKAHYYDNEGTPKFSWDHGWVEYSDQIVDGNVDSMRENPKVPDTIRPKNYWGLKPSTPKDRTFEKHQVIDDKWIEANMNPGEISDLSSNLISALKKIPDISKLIVK